jgi:hypothetical protein
MNLQDKLKELKSLNVVEDPAVDKLNSVIDAFKIAVDALQFECGNRCAEQNPCNAKENIEQIKIKLGCV